MIGAGLGKPRIVGVRRRGDSAFVRVLVLNYYTRKPEPTVTGARTFHLVRERGEWRLADARYLVKTANETRAARKRQP